MDDELREKIGRLVHGDYHAVHGWDTPLVNKILEIIKQDRATRQPVSDEELREKVHKITSHLWWLKMFLGREPHGHDDPEVVEADSQILALLHSTRLSHETELPMQPLCRDIHGVVRFRKNKVVRYLLDNGGIDMNKIVRQDLPQADFEQFYQLIGYSVGGYGELEHVSDESYDRAEQLAKKLTQSTKQETE